ncbi:MAG: hypothetical protein ABIN89_01950 [Chitinophagaceae bacterium]
MKFLVSVLLMALLSFIVCIYFPWWSIAWVAFLVIILVPQKPLSAFLAGFVALFLLWSAMAFYISLKNENILAHKISLIILKSNSPISLVLLTGLIGALIGGFAALAGSFLRKTNSAKNG